MGPRRIAIFDTIFRDREQAPRFSDSKQNASRW